MHFSHIDGSQIKKSAFPKHGVNRKVGAPSLIKIFFPKITVFVDLKQANFLQKIERIPMVVGSMRLA